MKRKHRDEKNQLEYLDMKATLYKIYLTIMNTTESSCVLLKVTTFPPYLMQTFQNRIKLWVQYPSDEDFLC